MKSKTTLTQQLERIGVLHPQISDATVRHALYEVVYRGFVEQEANFEVPSDLGMSSVTGNRALRNLLSAFLLEARLEAKRRSWTTPLKRWGAFEKRGSRNAVDKMRDYYFGSMGSYERAKAFFEKAETSRQPQALTESDWRRLLEVKTVPALLGVSRSKTTAGAAERCLAAKFNFNGQALVLAQGSNLSLPPVVAVFMEDPALTILAQEAPRAELAAANRATAKPASPEMVHFKGKMVVKGWPEKVAEAQLYPFIEIDGKEFARVRYEPGDGDLETCGDCAAGDGQCHVSGCDQERCPSCRGQLISCDCDATHVVQAPGR